MGRGERPSVFCAALTIVNDDEVEGLESFSVEFSDSESGLSTECQVDIIDNDNPGIYVQCMLGHITIQWYIWLNLHKCVVNYPL